MIFWQVLSEDEHYLKASKEAARKSANYQAFQRVLIRNVCIAGREVGVRFALDKQLGRLYLHPEKDTTVGKFEELAQRVRDIFGVHCVAPCWFIPKSDEARDLQKIYKLANSVLDAALQGRSASEMPTVKVACSISQTLFTKSTGLGPTRLAVDIAEHLNLDGRGIKVQLRNPELEVRLEVRGEGTFCSASRLPALQGLPVGSSGRAMSLLSGGIDSPVASYMMMSRGISVTYISFHSAPYLGEQSKQKLAALVKQLSRFQPYRLRQIFLLTLSLFET